MNKPDFNELRKVLNGDIPSRPVLFELQTDGCDWSLAVRTEND